MIDLNYEPVTLEEILALAKLEPDAPIVYEGDRILFDWLVARLLAEKDWTAVSCGDDWVLFRIEAVQDVHLDLCHEYFTTRGRTGIIEYADRFDSPLAALQAIKHEAKDA